MIFDELDKDAKNTILKVVVPDMGKEDIHELLAEVSQHDQDQEAAETFVHMRERIQQ